MQVVRKSVWTIAVFGVLVFGDAAMAQPADDSEAASAAFFEAEENEFANRDPFEKFNRAIFRFNTEFDRVIFRPVARTYRKIMPDPLETGVSNFFSNLNDVQSAANSLLQGDINGMFSDLSRVLINSSVGLLGFFDVASRNGIPKRGEDLGQTFGVWGFDTGPYIMLPLVGPSSVRDTLGWWFDFNFDPVAYVDDDGTRWGLFGLRYIDRRAAYLTATEIAEQAALDPYIFYREGYFQRRSLEVRNGAPSDDF